MATTGNLEGQLADLLSRPNTRTKLKPLPAEQYLFFRNSIEATDPSTNDKPVHDVMVGLCGIIDGLLESQTDYILSINKTLDGHTCGQQIIFDPHDPILSRIKALVEGNQQ